MGCSNFATNFNIQEIIDWHPVPSDRRYVEKIVKYKSGRTTRMTRLSEQNTEYPHYTEFYGADGKEVSRTHYSTAHGRDGEHPDAHKTAQSILDDLDEAIRSLRSK
ncbi:hypothetical protein BROC_00901 [Candidatus Brocadiaceae bacterium]|nr:hypothetical protein BROC_00901 [Candidatus Brocadiaceae bacterium]